MVMMEGVAMMPIPIVCPATMNVPPSGPVTPVPGRVPCNPCVTPEPIVDYRTINVYGLYDIVGSINVLIANYLYRDLILLVLFNIYRGYILIDILCQYGLKNDEALVAFSGLNYAQIIYLPIAIEIKVTERTIRIVEHRLELLQVLSLCE